MRKLFLSLVAFGAALGLSAQTYTDVTPAKFDFNKYEVGALTNFWNECIANQNHGNAGNTVVALGDKVTDEGYALFYGNPNGGYDANTFTSIVNVEGVGNVLQFGNTGQTAGWGGFYFVPCAEQQTGTMRITVVFRGLKGDQGQFWDMTGGTINVGSYDLDQSANNNVTLVFQAAEDAGAGDKWYKATVEYAPTYALRFNFAQFIWGDYIQVASVKFEKVGDIADDYVPVKELAGPADYAELVPAETKDNVSVAGSFNGWNTTANFTEEIVDNCGTIVVENWTNGPDGFKVLVNGEWYGDGRTVVNGEWNDDLPDGANMWLPADAQGQAVTFTIAVDTHSFKAEWEPAANAPRDVTPAKFDFSKYEVGPLTDFWNECIANQNHGNAGNTVVALGDKVTDEGYALFYGNPNGGYDANTFTSIVNVEGVGNVLQFGNTGQTAGWGGFYFVPCAEQQTGTMRITVVFRGLKGDQGQFWDMAGGTINVGSYDLKQEANNNVTVNFQAAEDAGTDNKWYKATVEYAPTYALRFNFAQFIWGDYIQVASVKFETLGALPEDYTPVKELAGPATWEELTAAPAQDVVVRIAGSFNGWSTVANTTTEIVDNCATLVVENWTNGADGFKLLINDDWYGNGQVIAADTWTEMINGGHMCLADDAEGQTVTFTVAVDTKTFKAEWTSTGEVVYPSLYLRGTFNEWGVDEAYKFSTEDGVLFVIEQVEMPMYGGFGAQFKIADANWGVHNYGAAIDGLDIVYPGEPFTLVRDSNSQNLNLVDAFTGKVEFDLSTLTLTLTSRQSGVEVATVAAPAIMVNGRSVTFSGVATVYSVSGAQVAAGTSATLLPGLYVATVNGKAVKFVVK